MAHYNQLCEVKTLIKLDLTRISEANSAKNMGAVKMMFMRQASGDQCFSCKKGEGEKRLAAVVRGLPQRPCHYTAAARRGE
ncbi:hypothetical protein IL59_0205540 [Brucella suis bv. 4 str. 40]|nr:hypothetical protein IL59_0205540 [Brucella suis bv. 4 str. 40]